MVFRQIRDIEHYIPYFSETPVQRDSREIYKIIKSRRDNEEHYLVDAIYKTFLTDFTKSEAILEESVRDGNVPMILT